MNFLWMNDGKRGMNEGEMNYERKIFKMRISYSEEIYVL
jgi:hypothetical protein